MYEIPFLAQMGAALGVSPETALWLFAAASVWTVILKGFSLWFSARNGQKIWFVALLVVNTVGLLEAVYLLWFRRADAAPLRESSPSGV